MEHNPHPLLFRTLFISVYSKLGNGHVKNEKKMVIMVKNEIFENDLEF